MISVVFVDSLLCLSSSFPITHCVLGSLEKKMSSLKSWDVGSEGVKYLEDLFFWEDAMLHDKKVLIDSQKLEARLFAYLMTGL